MNLSLKDGKFYRNGIIEKPDCNNADQIALLKAKQAHADELHTGHEVSADINDFGFVEIIFQCMCEGWVDLKKKYYQGTWYENTMAGVKGTCKSCDRKYIVFADDGCLFVKLNTK